MEEELNNEEKIKQVLGSIGLSKNEILVYLSLIKNPICPMFT